MKWFILFFLFTMNRVQAQQLESYTWKNRVIILFENDKTPAFKHQLSLLQKHKKALDERDMILLIPDDKAQLRLKYKLEIATGFTGLVLLGKDGGIKLKKAFIVSPQQLFDLVDGMPMRKYEIKQQKGD